MYASDVKKTNSPVAINFSDILPFNDQLSNPHGNAIDVIIETPGRVAEAVEDMVKQLRNKYESVGFMVPGVPQSASASRYTDTILETNKTILLFREYQKSFVHPSYITFTRG